MFIKRGVSLHKNLYTMLFKKNINNNDPRPKFLFFLIKKTKHETYEKFYCKKRTKELIFTRSLLDLLFTFYFCNLLSIDFDRF